MKLVCGVGVNDFKLEGIKSAGTVEHRLWSSMIARCYGSKACSSTYRGCTVSDNFKSLKFFHNWVNNQVGFLFADENGLSWQLDKDIIGNGKQYSEDICCFVPRKLNTLMAYNKPSNTGIPGVHFKTNDKKFYAGCCDGDGVSRFIGAYKDKTDAFMAYKERKEQVVRMYAKEYAGLVDDRVTEVLLSYTVPLPDILAEDILA